ncbi:MAG: hypothetical protein PHT91_03645, partial [Candidatus Nanoarchaeia archaeon]|nr:hypothetical protein [Candidatus Nanoarchaeia archaeon]
KNEKYLKNGKVIELLKNSALSAHTDIVCISLYKNLDSANKFIEFIKDLKDKNDAIVSSMGKTTITLILHEKFLNQAKNFFSSQIQDINDKSGAIFVKCPKEANSTPGVIAYVSSLFSDENIPIYELISSYTDYVIILDEKHTYKMAAHLKKEFGC